MKLAPQLKVLLVSLVAAPSTAWLGWFLMAISVHNGGILSVIGICLMPGAFIAVLFPDTEYFLEISIAGQFILFLALGQLYLRYRAPWRGWWQIKQEKWLGRKWDEWFGGK